MRTEKTAAYQKMTAVFNLLNGGSGSGFRFVGFFEEGAGAVSFTGLITVDGQILVDFRGIIAEDTGSAVEGYVCIGYEPFSVTVAEYAVEGFIEELFPGKALEVCHGFIGVPEAEVDAVSGIVIQKLDDAEGNGHSVQYRECVDEVHGTIDHFRELKRRSCSNL